MMLGEIDCVPGFAGEQPHKVLTRFTALVLPTSSMCVVHEQYERFGNTTRAEWRGEEIRFQWKSAVLGFLRVWLGFAVVGLPFVLHWGENVNQGGSNWIWPSVAALVGCLAVVFVPKALAGERVRRLAVLRSMTGLGCDPSFRHRFQRESTAEDLMSALTRRELPTEPKALSDKMLVLDPSHLELAFAASWYRSVDDRAWLAPREAAWSRLTSQR